MTLKEAAMNSNHRKIDWIFFDLDGTLADSISVLYEVYIDFLANFGITGTKQEFNKLNGPSLPEIITTLKIKYNLDADKNHLINFYKDKIINAYKAFVRPLSGASDVLKELNRFGYKLLLVTSSEQEIAIDFINHYKWYRYFKNYVWGNEINKAKPSSDIYDLALKRANASSKSVAIIEDSCNGIKSAKPTGAFVIGLTNSQTKEELLKAGANITISHLREILQIIEDKV